MKKTLLATAIAWNVLTAAGQAGSTTGTTTYHTIKVDGLDIFYREAGDKNRPVILFLHGFPSSSHMYRDIMNDLLKKYHVIAPDYPGFGYSSSPSPADYAYSFDNFSLLMDHFIDTLHLKRISLYLQDYGGPVGFRIAARRPALIRSLIIQNANAYTEGLGDGAKPLVDYFRNPGPDTEKGARDILTAEGTKWQYTDGAEDAAKVSPDSYTTDQYFLDRKGNSDIQLALFRSYASNLALYDKWHAYFRKYQPPTLIIWGRNDKIFIAPGADAYKKDLTTPEMHLLNGGHFLLEEYHAEAARLIDRFLTKLKN
jgi:pimeloyl-ACP methyl ester carboxylesterase